MLSLAALMLVLVATAAPALPAESHEWYAGLRSPSRMPCCNERDCRPVASRVNHDTGREEIQATGRGTRSSTARCCPSPPPMAATMPAGATRREDLTFAASSFPAWHPSPPRRVQLESLLPCYSARGRSLRLPRSSLPGAVTRLRIFQRTGNVSVPMPRNPNDITA